MTKITLTRSAQLPDDLRVARALSAPHLGPRILFFSGGSALTKVSRALKSYTYNSAHLITPFDSGGSSQVLREAFDMPAVGDLRSRLMALADESDLGQPDIYALFSHRLAKDAPSPPLRGEVEALVAGTHPLIKAVSSPVGLLIRDFLREFLVAAPMTFDYRGASIGNLILAGGYLAHGRQLEPVLFLMSKMVDVRGTVRGVVDCNLQLGVELADGRRIHGQRQISGKEAAPIDTPITRLFLCQQGQEIDPASVPLPKRNRKLIRQADLICYPPGSLFSSVVANLLPGGVGRTIARCEVPKVYVPSLGTDPEALGLRLADRVAAILAPLRADAGMDVPATRLMSHVLCDGSEDPAACAEVTERHGIPCQRLPLTTDDPERYDRDRICALLVSMV
ncbi:GAK system CofD-like protein [Salipiger mangrovisoli]|uniref:GAK system CofD-like protein n=1 Tax=Salipiger mangrovisoli TaxID=2865933 RepID=A0ABR9X4J4_9RHOB|nr:GAK system CofD-like protein [Salipiger mangrovisoli]MBE9638479.1 GAK system CofD-like protein [Salipiger mangrovisoli]